MAKLINLNNFNKGFSDAFTPTFLQTQKLAQDESQYTRDMNFQQRQLQLGEAFRRDELKATVDYHNMQGEYYDVLERQGDERTKLARDEGITNMLGQGFTQIDERTSPAPADVKTYEAYGKSWIAPPMKPQEQARWESDKFGNQVEAKGFYDDAGKWTTTNYETVVSPPEGGSNSDSGNSRPVDMSNEVGEVNKLLEIYKGFKKENDTIEINLPNGEVAEWDKTLWRANAKRYTTDILSRVGIDPQGDYLTGIRRNAKIPAYGKNQWDSFSNEEKSAIAKNKEEALLEEIYSRRYKREINDQQYEALKYWALVGSR